MGSELAVVTEPLDALTLEGVVVGGNLAVLSPAQRLEWYSHRCAAAGLDPRTQPFQYLLLKGKLTLYATKAASDQLAYRHKLRVEILGRSFDPEESILEATCRVTFPDGRTVDDVGYLYAADASGEDLANARMKVITKAKRRTILSACGLGGLPDESEVDSIRDAQRVDVAADGSLRPIGRPADGGGRAAIEHRGGSAAELPSTRAAVNAEFGGRAPGPGPSRYPVKEKWELPAQRINSRGLDARPWNSIPSDEAESLNRRVAARCSDEGVDPFEAVNGHQIVNHLVGEIVARRAEAEDWFTEERKGKRVWFGPGKLNSEMARIYADGWRDWIRSALKKYLEAKFREATGRIDAQVYGDGPALDAAEAASQEPAVAPEEESQVAVPEGDLADEAWGPGRE